MQYLRKRLAKKTMQNDRIKKEDITGLVLAGGKGSRMGGVDKGLVAFEDVPLVEHVIGILKPQCRTLVVSANRNEDVYAKYGYPVVTDDDKNFSGPLAGIAAALEIVKTPYMVVEDRAEAIRWAMDHAQPGDIVSLSPACAAFDLYPNFEVRGRHFKEIVNKL